MQKTEKLQGMVTAVYRDRYEINCQGKCYYGRLKTSSYYQTASSLFPTVGDEVEFIENPKGDCLLVATLPRRSCFLRQNSTQGMPEQAVAANFDYVFLVMSLNHDFHLTKLAGYFMAAAKSGGATVLLLSKADLCDHVESYLQKVRTLDAAVPVIPISVVSGEGIKEIWEYLQPGKKAVFLGSSGVGKSSLVNYLTGMEMMKTAQIRESDSQGRHTTVSRQCFYLENGAVIMDTPGMRRILMSKAEEEAEGPDLFSIMEETIASCKFHDCTHTKEPGCAVREALKKGIFDRKQYETYLDLLQQEARARGREQHRLKRMEKPGKYMKKDRKWKEIDSWQ